MAVAANSKLPSDPMGHEGLKLLTRWPATEASATAEPLTRAVSKWQMVIAIAFLVSILGSIAARVLGAASLVLPIAIPALVLSGWAAFGHLVKLDDDLSGSWSNPDGDSRALP